MQATKSLQHSVAMGYNVLSVDHIALRPSELPPPTYLLARSNSSSSCDNTSMSSISQSSGESDDEDEDSHPSAPQCSKLSRDEQSSEEEDTESVDLLAIAREAHPNEIAAREREYLLTRPAGGHVVEGSLAATAGETQTERSSPRGGRRNDSGSVGVSEDREDDDDDDDDE